MFGNNPEKTEMIGIKRTARKFEEFRRVDSPIDFSEFMVSDRPRTPSLTPYPSPTPSPSPVIEEDVDVCEKENRRSSVTYNPS